MSRKLFEAKPYGIGASVRWDQNGEERGGLVWSLAEAPATIVVVPDLLTEDESHVILKVGKHALASGGPEFVESVRRMRLITPARRAGHGVQFRASRAAMA